MRAIVAALAVAPFILAGCGQASDKARSPAETQGIVGKPDPLAAARRLDASAPAEAGAAATAPGTAPAAPPAVLPMMAYAYSYKLELPAAKASDLLSRHQDACEAAGPALCQVVSARSSASGRDQAYGQLVIQAQPAWLKGFRNGLAKDAEGAGGRVLEKNTDAEDLTRSIVDTEASIRAATALQTRLERLLVERPGNLQDALAIEQELARVRGTIDATRSSLEVMKGRVATSKLTIEYVSRGVAAPDGVGSPIKRAFDGFLGNIAGVLAVLITLVSFLLVPALIAAPLIWWGVRRSRRPGAPRPPPANLQN